MGDTPVSALSYQDSDAWLERLRPMPSSCRHEHYHGQEHECKRPPIRGRALQYWHRVGGLNRAALTKDEATIAEYGLLEGGIVGSIDSRQVASLGFPDGLPNTVRSEGQLIHVPHEGWGGVV